MRAGTPAEKADDAEIEAEDEGRCRSLACNKLGASPPSSPAFTPPVSVEEEEEEEEEQAAAEGWDEATKRQTTRRKATEPR